MLTYIPWIDFYPAVKQRHLNFLMEGILSCPSHALVMKCLSQDIFTQNHVIIQAILRTRRGCW